MPGWKSRRGKLLLRIGQQFERLGELDEALRVHASNSYPGARERAIRVLSAAASQRPRWICCFRPAAPESEHEVQQLQRIPPRPQRSRASRPNASTQRKPEQLDLVLPRPTCSVEQAVREHLTRPEAPVYYVENARSARCSASLGTRSSRRCRARSFTRSTGRRPT